MIVMKRIIVVAILIISPILASAQASGGQIKRNTPKQDRSPVKKVTNAIGYGYTGKENGHEYVDLGLSVKWATCNVGAKTPSGWGKYFAWGEIETKSDYSWNTYFDSKDSSGKTFHTYFWGAGGSGLQSISPNSGHDVAREKWGGMWRMPTKEELNELLSKCKWVFTKLNKIDGYKVTGPNGKSIFLPCSGSYSGTELNNQGSFGTYWSSSMSYHINHGQKWYKENAAAALNFYWRYNNTGDGCSRQEGCPVRPVF